MGKRRAISNRDDYREQMSRENLHEVETISLTSIKLPEIDVVLDFYVYRVPAHVVNMGTAHTFKSSERVRWQIFKNGEKGSGGDVG